MIFLYENIKNRRIELEMTQEDLAIKTGYSGKSMIAKIERGLVDLPQSKIELFAKALDTTPQALMGWDSELEEAESVKARVTDWHQAMTTDDPDLFLFNKYKADPVFWENIRLLFYLPAKKKETVYAVIRGQVLTTAEEEKKEGINSASFKVG